MPPLPCPLRCLFLYRNQFISPRNWMMNGEFFTSIYFRFNFPTPTPHPKNIPYFPCIIGIALLTTRLLLLPSIINLYQHHRQRVSAPTAWENCHSFWSQLYLPNLRTSRRDSCTYSSGQEITTSGSICNREARRSPSPSFEDHGGFSPYSRKFTFETCAPRWIYNEWHDWRP